jgi:uncharacterized protein YneF (UPF0154 family)
MHILLLILAIGICFIVGYIMGYIMGITDAFKGTENPRIKRLCDKQVKLFQEIVKNTEIKKP